MSMFALFQPQSLPVERKQRTACPLNNPKQELKSSQRLGGWPSNLDDDDDDDDDDDGDDDDDDIHSKSKKVCGFYFSVSKNLRKKCVNRDDKILRQKCVNQSNVIRNASFENKNVKTNQEVCLFD